MTCGTTPSFRKIFPSFKWTDKWMVNQILNMPKITSREDMHFVSGVPAEEVQNDPKKIEKWIRESMEGCSCYVLFVGEDTYKSEWVRFEMQLARERGMGRLIVFMDGMKNCDGEECHKGIDPYMAHGLYSKTGKGYVIRQYSWVHDDGLSHIGEWIEDACQRTGKV